MKIRGIWQVLPAAVILTILGACSAEHREALRVQANQAVRTVSVTLEKTADSVSDTISSLGSFEMVAADAQLTAGDKEWLVAQGHDVPQSGLVQDLTRPAYNRLVTQRYTTTVPPWYDGDAARYEVTQRAALSSIRLGQSGGKVGRQYIEGTIAQGVKDAARNNARNQAIGQARDAGLRNVGGN